MKAMPCRGQGHMACAGQWGCQPGQNVRKGGSGPGKAQWHTASSRRNRYEPPRWPWPPRLDKAPLPDTIPPATTSSTSLVRLSGSTPLMLS